MKRLLFTVSLMMTLLAACGSVPASTTLEPAQTEPPVLASETVSVPTATSMPALPSDTASAPTEAAPNPKLPAAPFEAETYVNEDAGFALDYPVGWTVTEQVIGSRGKQIQFLSAPELAEA